MALPRQIIYNELSGDEIKHVLEERFALLLSQVPYLQKHITLPRVKMTLQVHLDQWADQPMPERRSISDEIEILSTSYKTPDYYLGMDLASEVNASPKGGQRPDQIRDEHGLPLANPQRGPFSHEDQLPSVENSRMSMANGSIVDRTGQAPERANATVVVQDFGPAGLQRGEFNHRPDVHRGGRDGGPIARPNFSGEDRSE